MDDTLLPWMGIDFGTCRSSAAVLIGHEPQLVSLGYGMYDKFQDIPTAVYIETDGSFLVGEEAVNARVKDTARYFDRFKLTIGSNHGITAVVDGSRTRFAWRDLVAAVLARIRGAAEAQYNNGRPLTKVILTVPAIYAQGGPQWVVMEEAAQQAGFRAIRIVREPYAAAIYYDHVLRAAGAASDGAGQITLVYDLGGGTFDPALIRRRSDGYEILGATDGVRCGGIFFDEKIREDFLAKCPHVSEYFRPVPRNADSTLATEDAMRVRRQARDAINVEKFLSEVKHRFAAPDVREVNEPEPLTYERDYRLTRSEFNALIEPLLNDTVDCCMTLVQRTGVRWTEIDRILMVGGSCNIPLVRQKLEAMTKAVGAAGIEICYRRIAQSDRLVDPLLAVSLGAAISLDGAALRAIADAHRDAGNDDEAAFWYRTAAEGGDADAQYALAKCFREGLGIAVSPESEAYWYQRAAERGLVGAQFDLAECFANGAGVQKDQSNAAVWYRNAAEQEHAIAELKIAECYLNGAGVETDPVEAVHWLEKAAVHGVPEAENYLGNCFHSGLVVEKDPEKAAQWFRKAAQRGLAIAQSNLGYCYEEGVGVPQNHALAVDWFHRGAAQGDANAHAGLGRCLANGTGVPTNAAAAVEHFRIAAAAGVVSSQVSLGWAYLNGTGVIVNHAEAVRSFRMAAEQESSDGYFGLGRCYDIGAGVAKDPLQEREWYARAAELGHPMGQNNLGIWFVENPAEGHDEEAVRWLWEAAKNGVTIAFESLAFMFVSDRTKLKSELKRWLFETAAAGSADAQRTVTYLSIVCGLRAALGTVERSHFAPNIPEGKLANVRSVYRAFLGESEPVLMVYDDTLWGGAKDGFTVTTSGIGCRKIADPRYWMFASFDEASFDGYLSNCCSSALDKRPLIRAALLEITRTAAAGWLVLSSRYL